MGSGSRDLPAVGSSAKLALLDLGIPFSSTGRTLVRLRKAEQYGLCLSLALVEQGREPWSLIRSEVCVHIRDHIIQSGFHPMKFWFSVVPTLPFTSLGYECAMVSPLDHPELDEGSSREIDMSPRDEQGTRVPKTSIRVNDVSPWNEQGARVPLTSIRVNDMSPRDEQGTRVLKPL
uniref:Uncharacterized protein n=1 Tax=Lepeophtheirus salmonis TaxID=72036 RepID=A0A0K2UR15_LEPSM